MGIIGGFFAVLLKYLISVIQNFYIEWLLPKVTFEIGGFNLGWILIPLSGSLICSLFYLWEKNIHGSGVPRLMKSIALKRGKIPIKDGLLKTVASVLTIGSGMNAGREGPIAFIGASFGSYIGKILHFEPNERRLLITCGLAAGIAGSFNAPIGGALFGIEIIFQGIPLIQAIPIFLAAGIGTLIGRIFFETQGSYSLDISFQDIKLAEYGFFLILGILLALFAVGWVKIFIWFQKTNNKFRIPIWIKLIIGGCVMGLILMLCPYPGVYGTGLDWIFEIISQPIVLSTLVLIGFLKLIGTTMTIGTGNSGGIFGLSLFVGALFGGSFGYLVDLLFPNIVSHPEIYFLIGMASFYAAAAQAPLNTSVLIGEIAHSFQIIPFTIITAILSFAVSKLFFRGSSVYTMLVKSKGQSMKTDSIFRLGNLRVEQVMSTNLITISSEIPILEFARTSIKNANIQQCPVMDFGQLKGIVFIDDVFNVPYERWNNLKVEDIMKKNYPTVEPNISLQKAIDTMYDKHLRAILVAKIYEVENEEPEIEVKGLITVKDILRVWEKGIE
jgi:CIC family chloride channel protein